MRRAWRFDGRIYRSLDSKVLRTDKRMTITAPSPLQPPRSERIKPTPIMRKNVIIHKCRQCDDERFAALATNERRTFAGIICVCVVRHLSRMMRVVGMRNSETKSGHFAHTQFISSIVDRQKKHPFRSFAFPGLCWPGLTWPVLY